MVQRHSLPFLHAVVLAMVCVAATAAAQTNSFELEIGYQWLNIGGNEEMYRSQIDQDDGPVLRSFAFNLIDPDAGTGLFDHLYLNAAGFGGSPSGRLRVEGGLADTYHLRLLYNHFEHFSALPGLANPFLEEGIVPGQHTSERDQEMLDLELQLLPGRRFSPLVGYRWNRFDGDRRTTYHVGQDEFQLGSDLQETESELRVGVVYTGDTFRGTLIQGWRDFESRERAWLLPGAGAGNGLRPILGRNVELDDHQYRLHNEAEAPVTTAHITGTLGEATRLTASYVRADYESEGWDDQLLSGSLVSFRLSRFFSGLEESVQSRTESPSWRGEVRVESDLTDKLSIDAGIGQRFRELDGWSLVSSVYLETLNLSGADPRDLLQEVEAHTSYERKERLLDVRLNARELGPFRLWAGWSSNNQDVMVTADALQISVPGAQAGDLDRSIDTFALGGAVQMAGFEASLEWQSSDADDAVVRTDFLDRDRLRLRLGWRYESLLHVLGTFEKIELDNRTEGIGYDGCIDHWAVNIDVNPTEQLTAYLAYDSYASESEVIVRIPQDFTLDTSLHSEDAELLEGGLIWSFDRWHVDAGLSRLDNEGSFGFELDRSHLRIGFDINDAIAVFGELESAEYHELDLLALGDFDADRFGVFVRWRR